MKTLDGLIEDLTEMTANPTEGDYENEGYYLAKDTLLYLKMYRSDKIQWEADRKLWAEKGPEIEKKQDKLIKAAKDFQKAKAEMEGISADYVALKQWWAELQENPPLSWNELKDMEGKPVWVEYMDDEQQTGWALIVKNPERPTFGKPTLFTFVRDGGRFYLTISGYGKTWQAYRQAYSKERINAQS